MSAAFPTGAYTFSHGLETAINDSRISNAASCEAWIGDVLQHGSGWNDAVFLVNAYRSPDKLQQINQLATALSAGAERLRETTQLGQSFMAAASTSTSTSKDAKRAAQPLLDDPVCLPVALGAHGARCQIPLKMLLPASLQTSCSNLVWIATRLLPLGQTQALGIIANLQPLIVATAERAINSTLDDLGSAAVLADLASLEHEQLYSRVCVS